MLVNANANTTESHVKFISYTGKWPNFCSGILTLEIDGKKACFGYGTLNGPFWTSGGGINPGCKGTYYGEWEINVLERPEQYRKYAKEIDEVFNENVEWGCCGGCI